MNSKINVKKIVALGTIGALSMGLLAGCSQQPQYTPEQIADITAKATADAVAAEKVKAQAEKEALATSYMNDAAEKQEVISDYEKALAEITAERDALKETKTTEATENSYEYKLIDDLDLNAYIPSDELTHSDLTKLFDGEVRFDGEDYDARETVEIVANAIKLGTSLTYDEEFEAEPYMVFEKEDSLIYNLEFEEPITLTDITTDEPLKVKFLGENLKIVDADSNSITVRKGEEVVLVEGGEVKVDNFPTVKLLYVTDDKVTVEVDGETKTIDEDETAEVNGVDIAVDEIFYQDYAGGIKSAVLVIGDNVQETVEDGDEYVEDDETFVWGISTSSGKLNKISLKYHPKANDLDDDYPVYKEGAQIKFPNEFLVIDFVSEKTLSRNTYSLDFTEIMSNDVKVAKIQSSSDKGIKVGTEELDEAYMNATSVFYKDEDNDWVTSTNSLILDFKDYDYTLNYTGGLIDFAGIDVKTSNFQYLGTTEDDAEAADVQVDGTNIGTTEHDVLTSEGVIVYNVDGNAESDEVEISVPSDEVKYVLRVR